MCVFTRKPCHRQHEDRQLCHLSGGKEVADVKGLAKIGQGGRARAGRTPEGSGPAGAWRNGQRGSGGGTRAGTRGCCNFPVDSLPEQRESPIPHLENFLSQTRNSGD